MPRILSAPFKQRRLAWRPHQTGSALRGDHVRIPRPPAGDALLAEELARHEPGDELASTVSVFTHDIGVPRKQKEERSGRFALLDDRKARRKPLDVGVVLDAVQRGGFFRQQQESVHEFWIPFELRAFLNQPFDEKIHQQQTAVRKHRVKQTGWRVEFESVTVTLSETQRVTSTRAG